jgi:acetyltransferase-like isoleucine patch superfamily enzyme
VLLKAVRFLLRHGVAATAWYGYLRVRNVYCRWRLVRAGVTVGRGIWFDGPVEIRIRPGGSITVGDGCNFGKLVHLKAAQNAHIVIKDHVKINRFCIVEAHSRVTIEHDVLTAPYVHILDADHNFSSDLPVQEADKIFGTLARPVLIGAHAWLGSGVKVLAGVTVGEHAVVGANAVVTRDVPANAIAAGVPCRVIKMRDVAGSELAR